MCFMSGLDGIIATERQRSTIDAALAARGVENSSAKGVHAEAAPGAEWCVRMSSGTREVYFARP
jgi:hypothetical protein